MKVAVVGAGGVGSLFGGRLAAAGHDVWLIHRRQDYVEAVRRDGLLLDGSSGLERIRASATTDAHEVGAVDLVLVLTKSMDSRSAAESARAMLDDDTVVLTLQNGLGNLEILSELCGADRVLMGMTYVGAALLGPGRARHTAVGDSFIGEPNAALTPRVTQLAQVFTDAGMPTQATDQLWSMVWGKLVINSALNATAALIGASGADILRSDSAREMTGLVARETATVANALGIKLPYPDPAARVWQHCHDVGSANRRCCKTSSATGSPKSTPSTAPSSAKAPAWASRRPTTRRSCCSSAASRTCTPMLDAVLLLVRGLEDLHTDA